MNTNFMGLYLPIGTLRATATANGTTTTFLCSDADAADVSIGMNLRLYSNKGVYKDQKDFFVVGMSSSAGTTTITFSPAASANTATGNLFFEPEKPDVVTAIYNQFNQLDGQIQCVECTSATRPVAPQRFTGMIIWETDTSLFRWWNGATWQQISSPFTAFGSIGYGGSQTNVNLAASTELLHKAITVNIATDRLYLIRWNFRTFNFGTTTDYTPVQLRIRYAMGGAVTTAGTLIGKHKIDILNIFSYTNYHPNTGICLFANTGGPTGTATFGLFGARGADAKAASIGLTESDIYIEDMGSVNIP